VKVRPNAADTPSNEKKLAVISCARTNSVSAPPNPGEIHAAPGNATGREYAGNRAAALTELFLERKEKL
jgi:hypothetical protein